MTTKVRERRAIHGVTDRFAEIKQIVNEDSQAVLRMGKPRARAGGLSKAVRRERESSILQNSSGCAHFSLPFRVSVLSLRCLLTCSFRRPALCTRGCFGSLDGDPTGEAHFQHPLDIDCVASRGQGPCIDDADADNDDTDDDDYEGVNDDGDDDDDDGTRLRGLSCFAVGKCIP